MSRKRRKGNRVGQLLDEAHQVDEDQARILMQRLHVARMPVTEIHYTYAGVERKTCIWGQEQRVYAPKAPWHRGRLVGLILGLVFGIAVVIALVVGVVFWID